MVTGSTQAALVAFIASPILVALAVGGLIASKRRWVLYRTSRMDETNLRELSGEQIGRLTGTVIDILGTEHERIFRQERGPAWLLGWDVTRQWGGSRGGKYRSREEIHGSGLAVSKALIETERGERIVVDWTSVELADTGPTDFSNANVLGTTVDIDPTNIVSQSVDGPDGLSTLLETLERHAGRVSERAGRQLNEVVTALRDADGNPFERIKVAEWSVGVGDEIQLYGRIEPTDGGRYHGRITPEDCPRPYLSRGPVRLTTLPLAVGGALASGVLLVLSVLVTVLYLSGQVYQPAFDLFWSVQTALLWYAAGVAVLGGGWLSYSTYVQQSAPE